MRQAESRLRVGATNEHSSAVLRIAGLPPAVGDDVKRKFQFIFDFEGARGDGDGLSVAPKSGCQPEIIHVPVTPGRCPPANCAAALPGPAPLTDILPNLGSMDSRGILSWHDRCMKKTLNVDA